MSSFVKGNTEGLEGFAAVAGAMLLSDVLPKWEDDVKALHTKADTVSDSALVELANTSGSDADKSNAKLLSDLKAKVTEVTKALRESLAPGTAGQIDKKAIAERVRAYRTQLDASQTMGVPAEWLAAQGYTAATAGKVTRARVSAINLSGSVTGTAKNFTEAANLIKAQTGTAVVVADLKAEVEATAGKAIADLTDNVVHTKVIDEAKGVSVTLTVIPKVAE
jgi:hypothetical protein